MEQALFAVEQEVLEDSFSILVLDLVNVQGNEQRTEGSSHSKALVIQMLSNLRIVAVYFVFNLTNELH